ncbi:DUF4145 domain-containing protein [Phreatobacter cathodiphilus]|uniref:DUF4145 domain-containing protein n=1 Tax=Phreatobacter cathodiphilus TaxID=1868589 RepID=A0A2S0NG95_9HYPH|nr:DUF4145 domain-containing protein [Phreatobacter cathodiphilus]AVO46923.1 hypothetical protein C6569_18700 [Phreatobacter cathodiphilus]
MAVLTTTCGHCGTEKIGLHVKAYAQAGGGVAAFTTCPKCTQPAVHLLRPGPQARATEGWFNTSAAKADGSDTLTHSGWAIRASYPAASTPQAPDHCPEDIGRVYIGARMALLRGELDAAGMLIRKVLEVATKRVLPQSTGTLASRIDEMAKGNLIPEAVKSWAHQIRIIGNDAAHDAGEPPKAEVAEAIEFADAFLIYVFTMPERVRQRHSRRNGTP